MSEFERFQGKAGTVGFCRSLYVGSVLLLNIGLARVMGPDAFGSFQQVFMFNALFLILTLGIPETLYYFLPRLSEEDRPRFLGQTLVILLFSGSRLHCSFLVHRTLSGECSAQSENHRRSEAFRRVRGFYHRLVVFRIPYSYGSTGYGTSSS